MQCYNPDRGKIPTPHIDNLATQGMKFTDAHSSSGVCSPSRYSLLTGRYHWRSRLQRGIVGIWEDSLIDPDRLTLGGLARQHGYHTAMAGKWHLGWDWPIPEGKKGLMDGSRHKDIPATDEQKAMWRELFSQDIPGGPMDRGFDRYFGTCVPNWPPFCFIEDRRTVGIPGEFLPVRLFGSAMASTQGPALKEWTLEPILPTITDRACEWIAEFAKDDKPFFLFMPLTPPPGSGREITYEITGLDAGAVYVLGFSAWDADGRGRRQSLEVNGTELLPDFAPIGYHAGKPTHIRVHLPLARKLTSSGAATVTVKSLAGPNAVISEWDVR